MMFNSRGKKGNSLSKLKSLIAHINANVPSLRSQGSEYMSIGLKL